MFNKMIVARHRGQIAKPSPASDYSMMRTARARGMELTFEDVPNHSFDFNDDFGRFVENLALI